MRFPDNHERSNLVSIKLGQTQKEGNATIKGSTDRRWSQVKHNGCFWKTLNQDQRLLKKKIKGLCLVNQSQDPFSWKELVVAGD